MMQLSIERRIDTLSLLKIQQTSYVTAIMHEVKLDVDWIIQGPFRILCHFDHGGSGNPSRACG